MQEVVEMRWTRLGAMALLASCAARAQHNLDDAMKDWPDLRIMEPGQVRTLTPQVRADLAKRECKVPLFTKWDGPHNVIRGEFAKAGQQDVAVLCLKADDMSIVIYRAGEPDRAEELRKFPADAYRMIHTVTPFVLKKRAIRDEAVERLPAFDHDAIEDGPVGGRTETMYNLEGRWLQVF
jgi:hypothetical protein